MRETVQKSPGFDMDFGQDDISITAARRGRHNIFIKRERDEDHDQQHIYNCGNDTHSLWSAGIISSLLSIYIV